MLGSACDRVMISLCVTADYGGINEQRQAVGQGDGEGLGESDIHRMELHSLAFSYTWKYQHRYADQNCKRTRVALTELGYLSISRQALLFVEILGRHFGDKQRKV